VYPSEIVSVKPQIKLSKMPQLLMSLWPIGSSSSVTGKQELGGYCIFSGLKIDADLRTAGIIIWAC